VSEACLQTVSISRPAFLGDKLPGFHVSLATGRRGDESKAELWLPPGLADVLDLLVVFFRTSPHPAPAIVAGRQELPIRRSRIQVLLLGETLSGSWLASSSPNMT